MTGEFSTRNTFRKNGMGTNVGGSGRNIITMANPCGGSSAALLQKQLSFKTSVGANQFSKPDQIEVVESANVDGYVGRYNKNTIIGWICCAPCVWLRTSTTVHKMALTSATLLVTTLLVASPILFLISTAPSPLPRECYIEGEECLLTTIPPPECSEPICQLVSTNIQAKINWTKDPCTEFKQFGYSQPFQDKKTSDVIGSVQQSVELRIQNLLQYNTTTGHFKKLGQLFKSCLKQQMDSTVLNRVLNKLGGYLPIRNSEPASIASLISKMDKLGPTPLIDIYFDLSYGKRPHIILIISSPSTTSTVLESKVRWMRPKAPFSRVKQGVPKLLFELIEHFLPKDLSPAEKFSEKESILTFVKDLNEIQVEHSRRGFWDSSVIYNISTLHQIYPILNWTTLIPSNWSGPTVVMNSEYLIALEQLLTKYPTRVAHNSLLLLFALGILPKGKPSLHVCTRATMWALPDVASALFIANYSSEEIQDVIKRAEVIFKSLKAHLKRAPSLKGAALVKLSALKIQPQPWEGFTNVTMIIEALDQLPIQDEDWFQNILDIYQRNIIVSKSLSVDLTSHEAWAYPMISNIFYDALSHSIVVPLSVILTPYFDEKLPPYMHYASVGVPIAKEILRSITKNFDDNAMRCVPQSVEIFSNYSRMDILIQSGGMQIAYHSMLSLTAPKGMARLVGLNLTPTQIFFLVSAQDLCAESEYLGIDTNALEFENILGWLVAQGGSATEVFKCPSGSMIYTQKTCNVL